MRSKELTLAFLYPEYGLRSLDPSSLRAVLRLEDHQDVRKGPGYKETWRRFWLLANVLQFVPRSAATTTELTRALGDDALPEPFSLADEQAMMAADSGSIPEDLRYCDELIQPLIKQVLERKLPLPAPFELEGKSGVAAEAELAWPSRKLAVLAPWQERGRGALESKGWTCLGAESLLADAEQLWQTLTEQT